MSKVIIYGYSNLGFKIANSLRNSNYEVIVVDFDENNYKKALTDNFKAFNKELLIDEELIEIGIDEDLAIDISKVHTPNFM